MFFQIGNAQQNLVPNPSFEEYYSCPVSNDLNNDQLELAKGWWKPTLGTSDYFNRCHTGGVVGVPNNFWGFQEPFDGDGYVGFVPHGWIKSTGESTGYEYIQTRLNNNLSPCTQYLFEMYVSNANFSQYGFGNIGALFTRDSINSSSDDIIYETPQVIWESSPIIDTAIWVKIRGTFIANGDEKYLTIGYFEESIDDDTTFIQSFATIDFAGYYYVDSVSVVELEKVIESSIEEKQINVFTPNNDFVNDIWYPQFICFDDWKCDIVNRWGNVIYTFIKSSSGWDGNDRIGKKVTEGTYYYNIYSQEHSTTGFIQLIR